MKSILVIGLGNFGTLISKYIKEQGHQVMGVDILENRVTSAYRIEKKFRQEDLAEKAELSPNYIGMIERGEKTPSLETLVAILNALNISADMVLCDVLQTGYQVKSSVLNEKISELSEEDQSRIFDVVDVLIQHSKSSFSVKQQ